MREIRYRMIGRPITVMKLRRVSVFQGQVENQLLVLSALSLGEHPRRSPALDTLLIAAVDGIRNAIYFLCKE